MPGRPAADAPPERACAVMEAELEALSTDIGAARARARRAATAGLDLRRDGKDRPAEGDRQLLQDGRTVRIRPVETGDAHELEQLFGRLSALSRHRRFLAPIDRLSRRQLDSLTRIDHIEHEALIAIDAATGQGVGVIRYVRDVLD